ncbi:MAG TPA: hypothetical protein VHK67_00130 [Rhabdochlamydiaceae bacterium]|jgi:hypothetical protein|nr:hypothetical protein [Rhabdochlamydiaceae bacterium]
MASTQVLFEMEKKLDELIANANQLRDCETGSSASAELEHQQGLLLNALLQLNNSIDENEKYQLWQRSPDKYLTVEKKIVRLSRLNQKLLRSSQTKHVKKARMHKRKFKRLVSD